MKMIMRASHNQEEIELLQQGIIINQVGNKNFTWRGRGAGAWKEGSWERICAIWMLLLLTGFASPMQICNYYYY